MDERAEASVDCLTGIRLAGLVEICQPRQKLKLRCRPPASTAALEDRFFPSQQNPSLLSSEGH